MHSFAQHLKGLPVAELELASAGVFCPLLAAYRVTGSQEVMAASSTVAAQCALMNAVPNFTSSDPQGKLPPSFSLIALEWHVQFVLFIRRRAYEPYHYEFS